MFSLTLPENTYHVYFSYDEVPTNKNKVVTKTLKVLTDDETIEEQTFKVVEKAKRRRVTAHLLIGDRKKEALEVAVSHVECSLQDNFEKNRGRKLALAQLLIANFDRSVREDFWHAYFYAKNFEAIQNPNGEFKFNY